MKKRKIILAILILFIAWIAIDINFPFKTDLRRLDAIETARLEGAMWKSYYEKEPVTLFMQSAELMRSQFHLPFWRSYLVSYYAAKAAFVFKDGTNRNDYAKALPYLVKYYSHINKISPVSFNVDTAATLELEWWIIRREREQHAPSEWEQLIAKTSSTVYHISAEKFSDYSHLRVEAMLLRDEKSSNITENDWTKINEYLVKAWQNFSVAVKE